MDTTCFLRIFIKNNKKSTFDNDPHQISGDFLRFQNDIYHIIYPNRAKNVSVHVCKFCRTLPFSIRRFYTLNNSPIFLPSTLPVASKLHANKTIPSIPMALAI